MVDRLDKMQRVWRMDIRYVCSILLGLWIVFPGFAADIVVIDRHWKITYVEKDKWFRLNLLNPDGTARKALFNRSASEVKYDDVSGKEQVVNTKSFAHVTQTQTEINDEFGDGRCYTFTFTEPDNGDDVRMEQRFYVYEKYDYLITDLSITGDVSIRSNYLAPISVNSTYMLFQSNSNNRMLKVPFDNDGFVRYHTYKMNQGMISYEVSALYNGDTREGLILGSVEHNRWKSAVEVNASKDGTVDMLKVFSGVSNSETRDLIPHGKIDGPTITSARMFVTFADDWRKAMEMYGHANTLIQPMRETWKGGTPFGWQSWGVLAEKNSYDANVEILDYYNEILRPGSFVNGQGLQIISLDAGDNLSDDQKKALIKQAEANGQIVGTYSTPFSLWWGSKEDLENNNMIGNYRGIDCVIKVNGEPYKLDGAYCLDPTHPGTKLAMKNYLEHAKSMGVKYIKMDFTSNGIVQADSYFAKSVKTAVEAYNNGFSWFIREVEKGDMFLALSIAPLFPYQYANSRRIACDTWGRIDQTEYSMNAISGGWWTNQFYQYNDPDHLVMMGNDDGKATEGENRARITNGAVSGMMLVSDNFSLNDQSGRGYPAMSRIRAEKMMMNKDINEMADLGRSFMPVYGHKEFRNSDGGAQPCFMYHTDKYLYVAVFNYSESEISGEIPLDDLDIAKDKFDEVKELWSGMVVEVNDKLSYIVPGKDVKVFRFHKKLNSIEDALAYEGEGDKLDVEVSFGKLTVTSALPMTKLDIFDMSGRLCRTIDGKAQYTFCVDMPVTEGMLLLRAVTVDGRVLRSKVLVQ